MEIFKKITCAEFWKNRYIFAVVFVLIVLLPLRWTFTGLDLWDSGYNCLNYVDFGPEYMKPSAFFSTILASVVGHLFYMLPYGDSYLGLRLYCGIIVSVNVLITAIFCINRLKLNKWMVIVGQLLAVSLCYSPTVIIYNHLSFLFLTIAIILLYNGLIGDNYICLAAAGFVLGINVYVRFPNIIQASLIIVVWYYMLIRGYKLIEAVRRTLVCMAGWIGAFLPVYMIINCIYGKNAYISGIMDLFSMSQGAEDYSAGSMIISMLSAYIRGGRRLFDIVVFTVLAYLAVIIIRKIYGSDPEKNDDPSSVSVLIGIISGVCLVIFSISRMLLQFNFHHYITVILTAAMFIDITVILCLAVMIDRKENENKKLISALVFMQMIVLSVGSNTGISPIMNSMFLAASFMMHNLYTRFIKCKQDTAPYGHMFAFIKEKIETETIRRLGKVIFVIAFSAYYIQCVMFGFGYVYEDAKNGIGGHAQVTDNRVLSGIRMNEERAGWMQGLTDYINEGQLAGHDVIVYGYAPALVYYLSLKPVIGSWPDLDSYAVSSMRSDMSALEERIDKKETDCPVIIFDDRNIKEQQEHNAEKWDILSDFMDKYGYEKTFSNSRFSVYENKY